MDWRIESLYRDYMWGYPIRQTWWQRFKARFTRRYEISVGGQDILGSWYRGVILTSDHQTDQNNKHFLGKHDIEG
jgi:hypothetical protein